MKTPKNIFTMTLALFILNSGGSRGWATEIHLTVKQPNGQPVTADCLINNYMNISLGHSHPNLGKCHKTEGDWSGEFWVNSPSPTCNDAGSIHSECRTSCCLACGGDDQSHPIHLDNLSKPTNPGSFTQSMTVKSITGDGELNTAGLSVNFTPGGFDNTNRCGVGFISGPTPTLQAGDVVQWIIDIPDLGQGCNGPAGIGVESLGNGTGLVGGPEFKVRALAKNITGQPVPGTSLTFEMKPDPKDTKFSNGDTQLTVTAGSDGIAEATVKPGEESADFTVFVSQKKTKCGDAGADTIGVTIKEPQPHVELILGAGSGSGQRGKIGTELPTPLQVRVQDTLGKKYPGITINFSEVNVPAPGQFSNPNPVTGSDGIANTFYTLGQQVGEYSLRAFCNICSKNPGQTATFIEFAKASNPQTTSANNSVDNQIDDGCTAWIVRKGALHPPRSAPNSNINAIARPSPACVGRNYLYECNGTPNQSDDFRQCTNWNLQPLPKSEGGPNDSTSGSVSPSSDDSVSALVGSAKPGLMDLSATYHTKFIEPFDPNAHDMEMSCQATRRVSFVGWEAPSIDAVGIVFTAVEAGQKVILKLSITNVVRATDEDIKALVDVRIVDASLGKVLGKAVSTKTGSEGISKELFVAIGFLKFKTPISKDGTIVVETCGTPLPKIPITVFGAL